MRSIPATSVALAALLTVGPAVAQPRSAGEAQTQEAPATSLGRQYGTPAGDALASPANPAAAARRDESSNGPGITVNPDMLGTQAGEVADGTRPPEPPGYHVVDEVVDEPPMRRLNDAGTGATSAKIGVGEREPADTSVAEDRDEGIPQTGDESYQRPGFDPAGDPAPPKLADGPVGLPPHPDPSK
ncbi:MAG TPA: hypothetical protein VD995_09690 [Azospirillum sp.]|nr:hypothetical protein [Azospirillum sp.]